VDWPALTAIGALLGGMAAIGTWLFKGGPGGIIADQRKVIRNMRTDAQAAANEIATLRIRLRDHDGLLAELEELRTVAGRLSLAALRGLKADALADAWDRCHDGIVLSRAGSWLWINQTLCKALGLGRDEVLRLGWETLIDAAALKRTRAVEGSQWSSSVTEYVNRYHRSEAAGGGWVQLRWHCTVYDQEGNTFCVVWIENPEA
jgi:PAS domain-containing protein